MEDDKKLCPLKFIVKSDPYGGFCNKYKCAWYNAINLGDGEPYSFVNEMRVDYVDSYIAEVK